MTLFEYMQENPWMTFFLILVVANITVKAVRGAIVLIRGYPPEHVDSLGARKDDE